MNFIKKKIIFLFLFICIFFKFNLVLAENGVPEKGIQISPTKISFEIKTGEEGKAVINVKNYDKNFSHNVEVQIENFYVDDKTANVNYLDSAKTQSLKAYDVVNWIEVEKNLVLAPNEAKNVEFKIKVPENVPTGGYYGAILFKTSENNNEKNYQPKIKAEYRASVLLNMVVLGKEPVKLEGKLLQFFPTERFFLGKGLTFKDNWKKNLFDWSGTGSLITHVKNEGNVHFKVKGEIEIYKFGNYYKTLQLNEQFVYPQKIRVFDNQFGFRWWDFGIYKAKIKLNSIDERIKLESETGYFIIFPWKTFLAIFLFLVVNFNFRRKQRN